MTEQDKHKRFIFVGVLIAAASLSGRAYGQSTLLNHPVFAKYPSPEDLQDRVAQFKREHADGFEIARHDFDLALRSRLELTPVSFPDERQPISIKTWQLHIPSLRFIMEEVIANSRARNGPTLRAAFYDAHLDEITVEPTVALRYVLLDIILNGWHDWEAWTSERLQEYRRRHPDIYRVAAVKILNLVNHHISNDTLRINAAVDNDDSLRAGAVFLRILLDEQASPKLAGSVRSGVKRIYNDSDALDFVVKLALEGESETVRRNGRSCMGSLTESLPLVQQRDFWVQYLDTDDLWIRSAAVSRVGRTIDLLKKNPKELGANAQLAERLRRIGASDTDPRIRLEADRRVTAYEDDSPPPGLIDYGKGKEDD